jgi:hypothetical protein
MHGAILVRSVLPKVELPLGIEAFALRRQVHGGLSSAMIIWGLTKPIEYDEAHGMLSLPAELR